MVWTKSGGVKPTVGVVGFGKLGTVVARLAQARGYPVVAAASTDPKQIALIAEVLTPGVRTAWATDVIEAADLIVLAVPLHAVHDLPKAGLAGKIVIDATNHWLEVDGPRSDWVDDKEVSSSYVQSLLPDARVVKAFNHLGYHDLDKRGRLAGSPQRVAMAIAGDDVDAVERVAQFVDELGFDPLVLGGLRRSRLLEPGEPAFGAVVGVPGLRALVDDHALNQPA